MCLACNTLAVTPRKTSRRRFLALAGGITAGVALAAPAYPAETKSPPKPQNELPPAAALDRLMKGNARYIDGVTHQHDFKHALVGGQNPYAAVLSCADSRIAPEYAFDPRFSARRSNRASSKSSAESTASNAYARPPRPA